MEPSLTSLGSIGETSFFTFNMTFLRGPPPFTDIFVSSFFTFSDERHKEIHSNITKFTFFTKRKTLNLRLLSQQSKCCENVLKKLVEIDFKSFPHDTMDSVRNWSSLSLLRTGDLPLSLQRTAGKITLLFSHMEPVCHTGVEDFLRRQSWRGDHELLHRV